MNQNHPQKNTRTEEEILSELTRAPKQAEVEQSFLAAMETVTKMEPVRIHLETHQESNVISTYLMNHTIKIIAGAAVFVLMLIGGYQLIGNPAGDYEDIYAAALEDEEAYVMEFGVDDFADLEETAEVEDIAAIVAVADPGEQTPVSVPSNPPSTSAPTPASPPTTESETADLEEALSALEALFEEDDINDSDLEDWFSDTSAGDTLNQSYEI